jgi:dolichol-phosphate mannosyltransferase
MKISVVIPVYNEQASLDELARRILAVEKDAEIVFIDDGSTDKSWEVIEKLCAAHPANIKALRHRRNFGKAAALTVGFRHVSGDVVFTMDADLQDDPAEIPNFLKKLDEGYDLVSGWKKVRHDPLLDKTLPSRVFNAATTALTGIKLHDFNCGFKAYRREVVQNLPLYGELHRFIPVFANAEGFRVAKFP